MDGFRFKFSGAATKTLLLQVFQPLAREMPKRNIVFLRTSYLPTWEAAVFVYQNRIDQTVSLDFYIIIEVI